MINQAHSSHSSKAPSYFRKHEKKKNETFCFKKECLKERELTNVSHCFFSLPIHEYMHIINSFM